MESTRPAPRPQGPASDRLCSPWTLAHPAAGRLGGASQHPLHFGAQVHSLWSMNICLDQKLSIWSSASMSSPFPRPPLPELRRGNSASPTGHPPTPRLQPAQGPHSELSLGRPFPPPLLDAPQDQWVHPSRISSQRAFPLAPAADVQAFPAGVSHASPARPPHTPPALWNEFTKVPLCLPGTLPFSKSWARMGVWRRAGASCNHSWALRGQFQEYKSQFPLGPMHGAEMSPSPSSVKDCGGRQTGS